MASEKPLTFQECSKILVGATGSVEEINRRFRKASALYHPDKNKNNEALAENFKRLSDARDKLLGSDEDSRQERQRKEEEKAAQEERQRKEEEKAAQEERRRKEEEKAAQEAKQNRKKLRGFVAEMNKNKKRVHEEQLQIIMEKTYLSDDQLKKLTGKVAACVDAEDLAAAAEMIYEAMRGFGMTPIVPAGEDDTTMSGEVDSPSNGDGNEEHLQSVEEVGDEADNQPKKQNKKDKERRRKERVKQKEAAQGQRFENQKKDLQKEAAKEAEEKKKEEQRKKEQEEAAIRKRKEEEEEKKRIAEKENQEIEAARLAVEMHNDIKARLEDLERMKKSKKEGDIKSKLAKALIEVIRKRVSLQASLKLLTLSQTPEESAKRGLALVRESNPSGPWSLGLQIQDHLRRKFTQQERKEVDNKNRLLFEVMKACLTSPPTWLLDVDLKLATEQQKAIVNGPTLPVWTEVKA